MGGLGFDEAVADLGPGLMRVALMLTGSQADAEDLWQDTFVLAHRHWLRVQTADQPRAYLRAMMVNRHTSTRRRLWHRERPHDPARLPAGTRTDGTDRVDADDALWQLLATLAPRTRAILVLRYVEDLGVAAIGEILGTSRGAVASMASRGLDRLRVEGGAVMTDLEERLAATLRARGGVASFDPAAAGDRARATARRRRRDRYAVGAGGVALTAAVVVGVAAWPSPAPRPQPPPATTRTGEAVVVPVTDPAMAAGTWRAVTIDGKPVAQALRPQSLLVLSPYGHWSGTERCPGPSGYFVLAENGALSANNRPTPAAADCHNVEVGVVMRTGNRLLRRGATLVVQSGPEREAGRFELVSRPAPYRAATSVREVSGTWAFLQERVSGVSTGSSGQVSVTARGEWRYGPSAVCPERGGTVTVGADGATRFIQSAIYESGCREPQASADVALMLVRTLAFEDAATLVMLDQSDLEIARLRRVGG